MPADTKKLLVETLEFCHQVTRAMLKEFPDDHLTHQNVPTDNHLLWTIGHLGSVHDWFATLVGGGQSEFPAEWHPLFGYKSTPRTDRGAYPPIAEVTAVMEKAYGRLLEAVKAQSSDDLAKPTQSDSHGLAPTRADAAARAAWHEGWHGGQIAGIRKALGLPRVL